MKNLDKNICWLCKRTFLTRQGRFPVGPPTKHHVIPKQKYHGRWQDSEVVLVCRSCQRQIHKFFTNNELKKLTENELRNHRKIVDYIKWIQKNNIE